MPGRKEHIITNHIYHVFNKSIDGIEAFTCDDEYIRGLETLNLYRFSSPPVKLSRLNKVPIKERGKLTKKLLSEGKPLVEIFCYTLMPKHYHLLVRQKVENGISKLISNFQNSYTRYFNTKNERLGQIFLGQFKARRVVSEEDLKHLARYIFLNPYSGSLINTLEELKSYPWSSFKEYIFDEEGMCKKGFLIDMFSSVGNLERFVSDNAGYQRSLEKIKYFLK